MRRANSVKQKNVAKLVFGVIITTIITVILSLSKYQTTKADTDSTSVATPVLSMSSKTLDVSISPVDSEKTYIFTVQNYNDETTSEVAMEYVLQINNLANLPLEFELYTYDNEVEGTEDLLYGNGSSTDEISIDLGENISHTYILKIKWRDGENSYLYSGEIDYVQIILNGTQVD